MTQAVFAAKSGSSNKIINSNVFNTNKSVYITEESESGPIELYTSAISEVKKGFLMKVRGGCGDLIKRFYFLKNNILYYYGRSKQSSLVKKIPLGLIYVKDKIVQKFERNRMHFISLTSASNGQLRAEFAVETEEDRDKWYSFLSLAC